MKKQPKWPRIRDLPPQQQKPFNKWLSGQTRPMIEGVDMKDQDAYYQWDYDRWIKGLPIID